MSFTPRDIIESRATNNDDVCLFGLSEDREMNHYTKEGTSFEVVYFTLVWMGADGVFKSATLRVDRQLIYGRCKLPKGEYADTAKSVSFPLSKFDRNDIMGGDYIKPEYPENATQPVKDKIDVVYKKNIDRLERDNDELYQALCIIADEYYKFWIKERRSKKYKRISLVSDDEKYQLKKPFMKRTKNGDDLKYRLFRVQMSIVRPGGSRGSRTYVDRVGRHSDKYGFTALVKDSNGKEAKIKRKNKNGKIRQYPIKKDDVGKYMTRKSLISGEIGFANTTASSNGINMKFEVWKPINVKKHKSSVKQETISKERLDDLNDDMGFAKIDSDVEEEMADIGPKSDDEGGSDNEDTKNNKIQRHGEPDSEPEDNDKFADDDEDDMNMDTDVSDEELDKPKLKLSIKPKSKKKRSPKKRSSD